MRWIVMLALALMMSLVPPAGEPRADFASTGLVCTSSDEKPLAYGATYLISVSREPTHSSTFGGTCRPL
jgi:hypothetical protein